MTPKVVTNSIPVSEKNLSFQASQPYSIALFSIKQWNDLRNQGKLDSSLAFQRGLKSQWMRLDKQESFMLSILSGRPIGTIYVNRLSDGTLQILEGKQRTQFIALNYQGQIIYQNLEEPALNKAFTDWTDEDRKRVESYLFPVMIFEGLDEEESKIIFENLNSGIALTKVDINRGKILPILTLPETKEALPIIQALLPLYKKGLAPMATVEECFLQALSNIACLNTDYAVTPVITSLLSASPDAIKAGASKILQRAKTLQGIIKTDESDEIKGLVKKSMLNIALAIGIPDFQKLVNFTYNRAVHSSRGENQTEWSQSAGAGSASKQAVESRIAIWKKVMNGSVTPNVKKPASESSPVSVKPDEKLFASFRATWDDTTITDESIKAVISHVSKIGNDVKPRKEKKTGIYTVSYIDKDKKSHIVSLSDLQTQFSKA